MFQGSSAPPDFVPGMLLSSKSYDTRGLGSHRPVGELVVGDKDGDSDGVFVGGLEGYSKRR